jgi:hypothetical protein
MPALYVYSFLLPGRKLPHAHAGPSERCRDERRVDTVFKAFTLDGRYLATYAVEGSEGAEPLSAAKGLVYYVPGTVVWKGRKIAATDFSTDLRRSRQPADSRRHGAELTQRAEIRPLDEYATRRRPA